MVDVIKFQTQDACQSGIESIDKRGVKLFFYSLALQDYWVEKATHPHGIITRP